MVLSAAVLGLGICCRNHVVFDSQVKYHKHSLLRVSRATASVANQFPATWYSFLCQPARSSWSCFQPGLLTVVFVVDSLSIYAINKQLKPIYNYAASIIEVVCVCAPLTSDQGQAGRLSVMQFPLLGTLGSCQLKLKLVSTLHSHLSPSPLHFYFRRHFSYNSMITIYVCENVCMCVCVCVRRYLRLITAKQLLDTRHYGISMVITTADWGSLQSKRALNGAAPHQSRLSTMGHNSEFDECEFVGRVSVFFYNSPPGAATKIDTSEER